MHFSLLLRMCLSKFVIQMTAWIGDAFSCIVLVAFFLKCFFCSAYQTVDYFVTVPFSFSGTEKSWKHTYIYTYKHTYEANKSIISVENGNLIRL